jgi:hypothetical protein
VHTTELPHPGTDSTGRTEAPDDAPSDYQQPDAVAGEAGQNTQHLERMEAKAAEIRALASLQAIRDMGLDNNDDTHHAMFICRSLRADRLPEAIFAHRILSRQAARDLLTSGMVDVELVQLVARLFHYIDGSLLWENGDWAPVHDVASRLGFSAQSPALFHVPFGSNS